MKMEILLELTSNKLLDNLKMEMEMEGVKASANSDIVYFFTSAQDGDPLQDDVRLCLGDDLKKAQDHNQRQVKDKSKDHYPKCFKLLHGIRPLLNSLEGGSMPGRRNLSSLFLSTMSISIPGFEAEAHSSEVVDIISVAFLITEGLEVLGVWMWILNLTSMQRDTRETRALNAELRDVLSLPYHAYCKRLFFIPAMWIDIVSIVE
ncbi:hypothetical protein Tco_0371464 [Tanacetum coccineum]|uniref:Uncharacterized protein n=1 Tax=Tanacetum coccineum TaxID=301880 RepID=A0ABQ5B627_9ASTR